MKGIFIILAASALIASASCGMNQSTGMQETKISCDPADRMKIEQIIDRAAREGWNRLPLSSIALSTGMELLGTPYRGHTLEMVPERLVVNLRELDCVTFVETCIAFALAVKSGAPSFETYCEKLIFIRYEKGIINGYASRLHYTSHWIIDNESKGILRETTGTACGIPWYGTINIMTLNRSRIRQMGDNEVYEKILASERMLSSRDYYYIPADRLDDCEGIIQPGDILAVTVNTKGTDVGHVGFACPDKNGLAFMHASSDTGKVEITDCTLKDYLLSRKKYTGVRVARLN